MMFDKERIYQDIDQRVKERYNPTESEQIISIERESKIIYFRNGQPIVEYEIGFVMTNSGPTIGINEVELKGE